MRNFDGFSLIKGTIFVCILCVSWLYNCIITSYEKSVWKSKSSLHLIPNSNITVDRVKIVFIFCVRSSYHRWKSWNHVYILCSENTKWKESQKRVNILCSHPENLFGPKGVKLKLVDSESVSRTLVVLRGDNLASHQAGGHHQLEEDQHGQQ